MIIGAGTQLERTLDALCREIEEQHAGLLCSVLLPDSDGVTMRAAHARAFRKHYCRAIDGVKAGPSAGSCGTAILPCWCRWSSLTLPPIRCGQISAIWLCLMGYVLCWSTPWRRKMGKLLGTFAIYYREPRTLTSVTHSQLIAQCHAPCGSPSRRDRDKTQLRAAEIAIARWWNDSLRSPTLLNWEPVGRGIM